MLHKQITYDKYYNQKHHKVEVLFNLDRVGLSRLLVFVSMDILTFDSDFDSSLFSIGRVVSLDSTVFSFRYFEK